MTPWTCTIWRDGVPYGITLHGADPDQIEADHPGVRVEGRQIREIEAGCASDDAAWIAARKSDEMA